jgi:internalin A
MAADGKKKQQVRDGTKTKPAAQEEPPVKATGLEEARRRIREARETGAKKLDLSSLGLEKVPEEIGELEELEKVDLGGNRLSTIPPAVCRLRNLKTLSLYGNPIRKLPGELARLERLEYLGLSNCDLDMLPEAVPELAGLRRLDIDRNQIMTLPPELRRLSMLEVLDLSFNPLKMFPEAILELAELRVLWLQLCPITVLPEAIERLHRLEGLVLTDANLGDLPAALTRLPLRALSLGGNPLGDEGHLVFQIASLQQLHMERTGLTSLPPEIGKLQKLQELHLSGNAIRALPAEIRQLSGLEDLDLKGNPLPIPPEILGNAKNPRAILDAYFRGNRRLNEAKLLLVGQGSVGKTSLARRLLSNAFDPHEDSTHGIARHRWSVRMDGEEVRVNIWDFGGQEIMHATHQFFLTKRSLYIVTVDSRVDEQENRIEYWLKLVQSFGADSPVLVVSNKADQHRLELARRRLQEKYPLIAGFFDTSCKTGDGIDALQQAITEQLAKLEHVRDVLPEPWFNLKGDLEGMKKSFLTLSEFEARCRAHAVTRPSEQQLLLRLFHDLGTILSFQDDARLQDTNVLSPAWVTNGVYKILNWNDLFQSKGILETRRLGELLDPTEYPARTHLFLIDMMRKFELCFPFEPNTAGERYLVPALLPKDEPDTGSWEGALAFEYHYDVLPDSVISRFLVRMHHRISRRTYWRFGAVLANNHCRAFVRGDVTDCIVEIRVQGDSSIERRLFLSEIRGTLDAIHAPLAGLKVEHKVVRMVEGKRVVIDYDDLLTHEELGHPTMLAPGTRTDLDVQELLNGVHTPQERLQRKAKIGLLARPRALPVKSPGVGPEEKDYDELEDEVEPPSEPDVVPATTVSPWRSGSFYLVAFVVVVGTSAAAAHYLSWGAAAAVLTMGVLSVVTIGAFQLRHDDRLKEKSFLSLMGETIRQLPLLLSKTPAKALPRPERPPKRALPQAKLKQKERAQPTEVETPALPPKRNTRPKAKLPPKTDAE